MRYTTPFFVLLTVVFGSVAASAQNIDLATVPSRDSVQLTIYNAEDLTLVRETRTLTFSPGMNTLQFSWANTLIDPTSVQIEFLSRADELTLVDTSFPHDRPEVLYWGILSDYDGEAEVQISYFTSGITWSADYVVTATPDEQEADVLGYVTVTNQSGEDYAGAQVRLVVGRINLVERIADLARRGVGQDRFDDASTVDRYRRNEAAREMMLAAEPAASVFDAGSSAPRIVREGLSEYFIFTVEGTQTVPNRWSKRIRSFHAEAAPVQVQYRYRPQQYGDRLVKLFLMTNDTDAGMGESPLPDGAVRVFRDNGQGGLSYLGQQAISYVPITDDIELVLGPDPEVIFELDTLSAYRDNIWTRLNGANVLRRVGDDNVRIEPRARVVGWDDHTLFAQHVRNYRARDIEVEVRRPFGGDTQITVPFDAENHDVNTLQYTVTVPAGQTASLRYVVTARQGENAEQNRVQIEPGDVPDAPWE